MSMVLSKGFPRSFQMICFRKLWDFGVPLAYLDRPS